jgi:hypothetical protein
MGELMATPDGVRSADLFPCEEVGFAKFVKFGVMYRATNE